MRTGLLGFWVLIAAAPAWADPEDPPPPNRSGPIRQVAAQELLPAPLIASATFGAPIRLEADEPRDLFLKRARQTILDLRQH